MSDKDDRLMAAIERLQSAQANPPDESAQLRDQANMSDLVSERDSLRATLAALQQRCAKLETALRKIAETQTYGDRASRIEVITEVHYLAETALALAPDAGSGATEGGAKP